MATAIIYIQTRKVTTQYKYQQNFSFNIAFLDTNMEADSSEHTRIAAGASLPNFPLLNEHVMCFAY